MGRGRWRTNTLGNDYKEWFQRLGLTEEEAVCKARKILQDANMEPETLENKLKWDEFVWSVCQHPKAAQDWQNSFHDLDTRNGALTFVMYMTDW